jgi:hypothetical protein
LPASIALSFKAVATGSTLEPNPEFQPIAGADEGDYQLIVINPETRRPFPGGEKVKIDANGTPQYRETINAELVTRAAQIGDFVIRKFYDAVQAGNDTLDLAKLAGEFRQERIPDGIAIDIGKLVACFAQVDEAQRRAPISPPLILVSKNPRALKIADRRFLLVLKSMTRDEFDEWMEQRRPSDPPKPRPSAHVSSAITDAEREQLLAEAAELASTKSAKLPAAPTRPTRRTPRARRTDGAEPPKPKLEDAQPE